MYGNSIATWRQQGISFSKCLWIMMLICAISCSSKKTSNDLSKGVRQCRIHSSCSFPVENCPFNSHHRLHWWGVLDTKEENSSIHRTHSIQKILLSTPVLFHISTYIVSHSANLRINLLQKFVRFCSIHSCIGFATHFLPPRSQNMVPNAKAMKVVNKNLTAVYGGLRQYDMRCFHRQAMHWTKKGWEYLVGK